MSDSPAQAAFAIELLRRGEIPKEEMVVGGRVEGVAASKAHTAELHMKPNPNGDATDAQIVFYKKIRQVDAGIRRVIFPDRAGCRRPWWWLSKTNWDNRLLCHDGYMAWLKDIACAGLGTPKPQIILADCALDTLCWDVLTRWGQDARTRAIGGYGVALLAFQVAVLLVFFLVGWGVDQYGGKLINGLDILKVTPQRLTAYGAAVTGASVGAWLIFVLRSLPDDWASLVAAASYTVKAWIRAAYVISFACIAVLMLRTGMVTFTIGVFRSEAAFPQGNLASPSLISALLIGFLFGLADLMLPTLISQRAQDAAGRLAGAVTPTRSP